MICGGQDKPYFLLRLAVFLASCFGRIGAMNASSSAQATPLKMYTTAVKAAMIMSTRPKTLFNRDRKPATTASEMMIRKYACCSLVRWFLLLFHSVRNCLNNKNMTRL